MQAHIVSEHKDLREGISELKSYSDLMIGNHGAMRIEIEDLFSRASRMNDQILDLEKEKVVLENSKTDLKEYNGFKESMLQLTDRLESYVDETRDHCKAIDLYLDKYMPVKIQNSICETMEASLT